MKSKIYMLLFVFSIISLIIAIYQFTKGSNLEAILSLVYSVVFFTVGIINKNNLRKV
ncbi:hypothetical protein LJE86_17010 [bacterium BMS3Abin03]|nr:hypothetical protein [bacterium BMS3Abin03]